MLTDADKTLVAERIRGRDADPRALFPWTQHIAGRLDALER